MNKKLIFLAIFFISLLAISTVSASEIEGNICDNLSNPTKSINNNHFEGDGLQLSDADQGDEDKLGVYTDEFSNSNQGSIVYSESNLENTIEVKGEIFENIQNTYVMENSDHFEGDGLQLSGADQGDEDKLGVYTDEFLNPNQGSIVYSEGNLRNSIEVYGGTFDNIQNAIDMAIDNDTIVLNGMYEGNGSAIIINKPLTFLGYSNTILDAKGLSLIFNLDSYNVTFKNITFKNNNSGFINSDSSADLNIFDCKFYGGELFSTAIGARYRDLKLNIYDSNFYNIHIFGDNVGTLIKARSLILFNSSFSNCSGDIQFFNDSKIFYSTFNQCNSFLCNNKDFHTDHFNNIVCNTSFTNCNGGCIEGNINNITNCTFNNISYGPIRIFSTPWERGIIIANCTFIKINCSSSLVFLESGSNNFTIYNCTFKDNFISNNNLINASHINGKISNCNFINNSANYGIFLFNSAAELEKNYFENNKFNNCSICTDAGMVINSIIKIVDTEDLYILENNTLEAIITDDLGNPIENTILFAILEYTGNEHKSSTILPKNGKFNITLCSDKIGLNNLTIGCIYQKSLVLANFSLNFSYRLNSFSYIKYLIDNSIDGDFLELDDYYEVNGYPIEINKSIVIKSKNNFSVFDAKNLSDVFCINADNVTLMNLYFTNSAQPIIWRGNNGILENCYFVNNTLGFSSSTYDYYVSACAIGWIGDNGTIFNCTFINNIANSTFERASSGAINWVGNYGKLLNSTFVNSSSFNAGAISCVSQNYEIVSSKFINCSSKGQKDSGIIVFDEYPLDNYTYSILDCDFSNNVASKGGAISILHSRPYTFNIKRCRFINNSATYGAAFYTKGGKKSNSSVIFSDCLFEENFANIYGYIYTKVPTLLENSKFFNNNGTVYCENTLKVNNSDFISNYAKSNGGAIYLNGNNSSIANSNFIDNYAEYGGAIFIEDSYFFILEFCNFEDNVARTIGGAVDYSGANMYIGDCSFLNNLAGNSGGAIYCNSRYNNLFNLSLINNEALSDGGAIYLSGDNSFIGSCMFISNAADRGGAIYTSGDLLDFIDNDLRDNYASKEAGAIYLSGSNNTIGESIFINNIAKNESGAICWITENSTLNDSIFINNIVELNENAGAISWYCENATIENTFIDKNNEDIPSNFIISEPNINLSISNEGTYYGNYYLIIDLQLAFNPLPNQDITLKLSNGISFLLSTDEVGSTSCYLPFNAGSYSVEGFFTNGNLTIIKKFSFNINKIPTIVTPTALSTTYDSGKYFTIKLVEKNTKKVLANKKLKLRIYTGTKYKDYTVTTNSKGIVNFKASTLAVGTHKVEITSAEKNYAVTKTISTIKIAKAKTTVKAPKVTYKYKKSKYFSVTVKNKATKKVVKSLKVKVKVYTGKKYKTYTIKTNSKGIAKLNTKTLAKGTHKVVISSGNSNYAISAKSTIVIKK